MTTTDRFHALDAVRAFALLTGIVLHATMSFFMPLPALDVSQSSTLAVLFYVIHTFRMSLFFVIAGFFARLLLERRGVAGFVQDRTKRIVGPMLVGQMIFVPLVIAVIIWSVVRNMPPGALAAAQASQPSLSLATLPLAHIWFLYYLCLFYVLMLVLRWTFERLLDRTGRVCGGIDIAVRALLGNYFAPWLLAVPLFGVLGFDDRIVRVGIPTPDDGLIPQVPALIAFGTAFGLGWFVHRQKELLGEWRNRWLGHLAVGIVLTVLCLTALRVEAGATDGWLLGSAVSSRAAYAACYLASIWHWSFGITGAALRFCSCESAVRRYLADSSYWLYLAHLPLVFFLQVLFARVPWHWTIKFPAIIAIALGLLLTSYHYVVRPTWIGAALNGRKYLRRKASTRAAIPTLVGQG